MIDKRKRLQKISLVFLIIFAIFAIVLLVIKKISNNTSPQANNQTSTSPQANNKPVFTSAGFDLSIYFIVSRTNEDDVWTADISKYKKDYEKKFFNSLKEIKVLTIKAQKMIDSPNESLSLIDLENIHKQLTLEKTISDSSPKEKIQSLSEINKWINIEVLLDNLSKKIAAIRSQSGGLQKIPVKKSHLFDTLEVKDLISKFVGKENERHGIFASLPLSHSDETDFLMTDILDNLLSFSNIDHSKVKILFVPYNVGGFHHSLLVYESVKKQWRSFDSMGRGNYDYIVKNSLDHANVVMMNNINFPNQLAIDGNDIGLCGTYPPIFSKILTQRFISGRLLSDVDWEITTEEFLKERNKMIELI